ncbi:hypothetical protein BX600DRAFT_445851 [Xylariales sp. PMI_506]|nr:hypothetical protein BX600DRAFT_445851 [Xylariales sp. PMI_506]
MKLVTTRALSRFTWMVRIRCNLVSGGVAIILIWGVFGGRSLEIWVPIPFSGISLVLLLLL